MDVTRLKRPFEELLNELYPGWRDNLHLCETPERMAKVFLEFTEGYRQDPKEHLKLFDTDSDEIVVVRNIGFMSLCAHHALLFTGEASVGYLPNGKILGLSKVIRIVHTFAKRFQVQEELTNQIADFLYNCELNPLGVGVIVRATHWCSVYRGVKTGNQMVTVSLRGEFLKEPVKNEFLRLVGDRNG